MKNKLYLLSGICAFVTAISAIAWAQSTPVPVYNRSGSGYSSSGPLNLQQMLQGNERTTRGTSTSQYYGGKSYRPYGLDNPDSAGLSVSPNEIFEARARRDREARQREQENLAALAKYDDELAAFQASQQQQLNPDAIGQQPAAVNRSGTSGRRVYDKNERDRFNKPRKVFNSLR